MVELTKEEKTIYGNRVPKGFQKLALIGKGGCAIVWKAMKDEKLVALKQIAKRSEGASSNIQSLKIEVNVFNAIKQKAESVLHHGMDFIAEIYTLIEERNDFWYASELGGLSLGCQLFEIKGEFANSERVYGVKHLKLHTLLLQNEKMMKQLLRGMIQGLDLIQESGVVHADIKPENILVKYKDYDIVGVKIIDFGSAFYYTKPSNIRMSTPEYLCPEALQYFDQPSFQQENNSLDLCSMQKPWSYDMWSIGAIMLEIYTGLPLWLSLKGKICNNDCVFYSRGLFAVTGRQPSKIIQLQLYTLNNLQAVLKRCHIIISPAAFDLLTRLLCLDPLKRLSPKEALEHEFFI